MPYSKGNICDCDVLKDICAASGGSE